MKGNLTEGALAKVFRDLYVGRKSGILHVANGQEQRTIRFRQGQVVHGASSLRAEWLGEALVRRGLISAGDLKRATGFVLRDKKRLGQVLLEQNLMTAAALDEAVATHTKEIAAKILDLPATASYEFEELPIESLPAEELTSRVVTGEIVLEAVRRVQDPEVVRAGLGELDRVLVLSSDPLLRFQKITLTPADGFLLSRIDGSLTAREVLDMIPMVAEEKERSLYGLVCTGSVQYASDEIVQRRAVPPPVPLRREQQAPPPPPAAPRVPAPPPTMPPLAAPAEAAARPDPPPPSNAVVGARTTEPERRPAAPAPRQVPPPLPSPHLGAPLETVTTPPGVIDPELLERRHEILQAYKGLKTKTHFEVLGIPRASSEVQVKEAYFRLAKRFHPDVHQNAGIADLREKLEAVFIRLGEAYEVLRNPRTRAAYETDLAMRQPRVVSEPGAVASAAPAAAEVPRLDPELEARKVEIGVRQAERLFEDEKYWDAIQLLETTIPLAQARMKAKAQVLLARAYMKNPKWLKRAEEILQRTIQEEPKYAETYFQLGTLYKAGGLRSRATSMFRKTLELKPDHETVQAELDTLAAAAAAEQEQEPEEAPPPSGGLLKRLFGKN